MLTKRFKEYTSISN